MWLFYLIWKCQGQFKKIKCLFLNKGYSNKTDEKLKKGFKNTFKFSSNDINKFVFSKKILMVTWMIAKSLMKRHYLKKKSFIAT